MRPTPRSALLVATLLLLVPLAGCLGSGGSPGAAGPADADGGPEGDGTGASDADGPSGDGTSGDGAGGTHENRSARVPVDAMPGIEPVETGNGWAHFQAEGTSRFAVTALLAFNSVGSCPRQGAPAGSRCSTAYNLSLAGDETLVEVAVTWASDRTDVDLLLKDPNGGTEATSAHGQVFVNTVCEQAPVVGECLFIFPPNGTTWEYEAMGPDLIEEGTWTIEVADRNNWETGHVQEAAGQSDGLAYAVDVWVYTVPAEPTHHPGEERA